MELVILLSEACPELRDRAGRDAEFAGGLGRPFACRQVSGNTSVPVGQGRQERGHVEPERDRVGDGRLATDILVQIDPVLERDPGLPPSPVVHHAFRLVIIAPTAPATLFGVLAAHQIML